MAENYGFPKIELGKIKIFPDPKEIKKILILQREPFSETGMDKDVVFRFIIGRQGINKIQMFRREKGSRILRRIKTIIPQVAVQGFLSSVNQELRDVFSAQEFLEHLFVVPHKKDCRRLLSFKPNQIFQNFFGLISPVNIIAQKQQNIFFRIQFYFIHQSVQFKVTAMDISDRKYSFPH